MANPVKGEVAFTGKNDEPYTFVLGTYGLAALQRRTGVATFKFFRRSGNEWGIDDILAVFYAGLLKHHQLPEERVADLIDEIGTTKASEIIREAVQLAFPEPEATKTTSRPTKVA